MYELHFAVPMAGAVLCTLNARLDLSMHLDLLAKTNTKPSILILNSEWDDSSPTNFVQGTYEYASFLETGHIGFEIRRPESEWDPISVNYTSGTTSRPQGVVYGSLTELPCNSFPSWNALNACLSMDCAYVPLQWLVPHLGGCRAGRHNHMPEERFPKGDI
ncbi:hypothetical protein CRYUN_Cryun17cG0149300 [Craigia yunnanensis]